jgi:hypothetical protein
MRLLIKKCKIGDMRRDIQFEATKDDWPCIFVEVRDKYENIISVPLETLIGLWEVTVRKKDLDSYLLNYDFKENE